MVQAHKDPDLVWVSGPGGGAERLSKGRAEVATKAAAQAGPDLVRVGSPDARGGRAGTEAPPPSRDALAALGEAVEAAEARKKPPLASRGAPKLTDDELTQLAEAARQFDSQRAPEAHGEQQHAPEGHGAQPGVSSQLTLEKLREQLGSSSPAAHRGAQVPARGGGTGGELDRSAHAECPPEPARDSILPHSGTERGKGASFSCDWESLGRPTVVLDPDAPLSYAFLK